MHRLIAILLLSIWSAADACLPDDARILYEEQDANLRIGTYEQDGQRYTYRYLTDQDWCRIKPVTTDHAAVGQYADLATTAVALSFGAEELNPAGPLILPAKYVLYQYGKDSEHCPVWMGHLAGAGYGAAAWNTLAMAGVPVAGSAIALAVVWWATYDLGKENANCEH